MIPSISGSKLARRVGNHDPQPWRFSGPEGRDIFSPKRSLGFRWKEAERPGGPGEKSRVKPEVYRRKGDGIYPSPPGLSIRLHPFPRAAPGAEDMSALRACREECSENIATGIYSPQKRHPKLRARPLRPPQNSAAKIGVHRCYRWLNFTVPLRPPFPKAVPEGTRTPKALRAALRQFSDYRKIRFRLFRSSEVPRL